MKTIGLILVGMALLELGCIPADHIAPTTFNRYWTLTTVPQDVQPPTARKEQKMPSRWVVRSVSQEASAATVQEIQQQIEAGRDEIEIRLSVAQADNMRQMLATIRESLESLDEIAAQAESADYDRWLDVMVSALVKVERVARVLEGQEALPTESLENSSAAGALMELFAEQGQGNLGQGVLSDMPAGQRRQLRHLCFQVVLRVGFSMVGKEVPDSLRTAVVQQLHNVADAEQARPELRDQLRQAVDRAAQQDPSEQIQKLTKGWLKYAPKAFTFFETFLAQWDKMDYLAAELAETANERLLIMTLQTQPQQEILVQDVVRFQPILALQGHCRITAQPELPQTGEFVVSFQSDTDTGLGIRFEGFAYGMARLFGLPLDNAWLREVRMTTESSGAPYSFVHAAIFMRAEEPQPDRRRMLTFQMVKRQQLQRLLYEMRTLELEEYYRFNYITPERIYHLSHEDIMASQ